MLDQNTNISSNPSIEQVKEVKEWLVKERDETGEGFYCNWDTIETHYGQNEMATISWNSKTVGFAIWRYISDLTVEIIIVEIAPTHRKKGLGKLFINQLLANFVDNGVCVVELQCSPETSEHFWRSLGFIDYPDPEFLLKIENKELYKILVPHVQRSSDLEETIELWNNTPYYVREVEATWKWSIGYDPLTLKLNKPIIHLCADDWRICWKKNGIIIKDTRVKCFSTEDIRFGTFLIINKLPPTP